MAGARNITVGEIRGVYGVRGWVKLFSYTDPRANLLGFERFSVDGRPDLVLVEGREQGKGLIGRFAGVDDRDAAAALHGTVLSIARDALPEPENGEYYWSDLTGLTVIDTGRGRLGQVDHLFETGAHDVMVVRPEQGTDELIPFVEGPIVQRVDLLAGEILVDWPGPDGTAQ